MPRAVPRPVRDGARRRVALRRGSACRAARTATPCAARRLRRSAGVALADLLTPSRCLACRAPGPPLCDRCDAALPRLRAPFCALCGVPTEIVVPRCRDCARRRPGFAAARAACLLEGPAARLVRAWKDRGLAGVAALAAAEVLAAVPPPAVDALVSVPPARARVRRRGVDGPAALAGLLGAAWGVPVTAGALVRLDAGPQRQRGGAARVGAPRAALSAASRAARRGCCSSTTC